MKIVFKFKEVIGIYECFKDDFFYVLRKTNTNGMFFASIKNTNTKGERFYNYYVTEHFTSNTGDKISLLYLTDIDKAALVRWHEDLEYDQIIQYVLDIILETDVKLESIRNLF